MKLDRIIPRLRQADRQTRLDTLLDHSRRLAAVPDHLWQGVDREAHRVHECQTPVFLWVEVRADGITLHADIPREAPTVRGFVSLLAQGIADATPEEVAAIPGDLLDLLGLGDALGMMRTQGLTALLQRVKRMVREASA